MRKTLLALGLTILGGIACASSAYAHRHNGWGNGYHRAYVTYVRGHHRTTANNTRYNNWANQSNVNPNQDERFTRSRADCPYY